MHVEHRQHHPVPFHLPVSRPELAQHFGPRHFVITDIIRMVYDSHAIGLVIAYPYLNVPRNHNRIGYKNKKRLCNEALSVSQSLFAPAVIRSLAGDAHVVRMAFHYTCIGNAGKLSIMKFINIGSTAVSHTCTQTT